MYNSENCIFYYISWEMTPTFIGGEKQAGISGGSQSPQLMEAFLKRNLNRHFYYMMEFVILKSYDDRDKISLQFKYREYKIMRNIKITIEYDGSRYQGWTRLGKDESNNTISAKIIDVLGKMTGEKNIELNCGCRTEVGVHAYAQVANFKTSSNLSTKDIQHYLNRYLPMDIAITEVEEVPDRFHAQLNAVSKTYVYRMTIMDVPSVFERKHTYHCFKTPDKKAMQQAALLFIGEHDFRNFSTAKKSKNTTREVYDIDIYGDNEEMQILIQADDFLHNMARLMIGTLLDIGFGLRKKEDIEAIFNGEKTVGNPCDPKGLYLQEVEY